MTKRKPPTTDAELFAEAMRDVKRLTTNKVTTPRIPNKRPVHAEPAPRTPKKRELSYVESVEPVTAGDSLRFQRNGISQLQMKNLATGRTATVATLDLHGVKFHAVDDLLLRFIDNCQRRHQNCVRIIHGKGLSSQGIHPPIKNRTYALLRSHPDVLAFCSAVPRDGGTGAVNVLLKRLRFDSTE